MPLVFEEGTSWRSLGLKGDEIVTLRGIESGLVPRQKLSIEIVRPDGSGTGRRSADLPDRYAR